MNTILRTLAACLTLTGIAGGLWAEESESPVSFVTEDGVTLHGTWYPGGELTVLLSSQTQSSEISWTSLIPELTNRGWSVFTYDYRGIGKSEGTVAIPTVDKDLRAAYRWVSKQGKRRIVLLGASLGSIASLKLAAELKPLGIVLLSIVRSYLGMSLPADPSQGVTAPLLFVTSEYDFAREETESVAAQMGKKARLLTVPASDHGSALFDGPYGEDVVAAISGFIKDRQR